LLKNTKIGLKAKTVKVKNGNSLTDEEMNDLIEEPGIDGFRKPVARHQFLEVADLVFEDKEVYDEHTKFFFRKPTLLEKLCGTLKEARYRKHAATCTVLAILFLNQAYHSSWLCVEKVTIHGSEWRNIQYQKTEMIGSCGRPSGVGPTSLYASWTLILACVIQFFLLVCPPLSTNSTCLAVLIRPFAKASLKNMIKLASLDLLRGNDDEAGCIDSHVWEKQEAETHEQEAPKTDDQIIADRKKWQRSKELKRVKLIYRPPKDRKEMVKGLVRGNEVPSVCIQLGEHVQIIPKSFVDAGALNFEMNLGRKAAHQFWIRFILFGALIGTFCELAGFLWFNMTLTDCSEINSGITCSGSLPTEPDVEYRLDSGLGLASFGCFCILVALFYNRKARLSEGELVQQS